MHCIRVTIQNTSKVGPKFQEPMKFTNKSWYHSTTWYNALFDPTWTNVLGNNWKGGGTKGNWQHLCKLIHFAFKFPNRTYLYITEIYTILILFYTIHIKCMCTYILYEYWWPCNLNSLVKTSILQRTRFNFKC